MISYNNSRRAVVKKRYYSPQKAAEKTGVNINLIQKLAVTGKLPIFLPDTTTEPRVAIQLDRYATTQYFNDPDNKHWPFCNLWRVDACPADCEFIKDNRMECSPEVELLIGEPSIPHVKLERLMISEDDLEIITGTLGKAFGGAIGGFTTGRKEIIDILCNILNLILCFPQKSFCGIDHDAIFI